MNQKMLEEEFVRSGPQLRSYVFRLTTHRQDTEDIYQDVFLRASTKLDSFAGRSSLRTWIFSIATNLVLDRQRSRRRWPTDAMDLARAETMNHPEIHLNRFLEIHRHSPHGIFDLREHIHLCFTCIGKTLPLDEQVAVLLKEVFDFKIAEIALMLNCSEAITKHLLFNGRKTMRETFHHRCSLVNKTGACHQCSELNGIFNPGQDAQVRKMSKALRADEKDPSKKDLFKLRASLIKTVDPYHCSGSDLQFFHFEHIQQVVDLRQQVKS